MEVIISEIISRFGIPGMLCVILYFYQKKMIEKGDKENEDHLKIIEEKNKKIEESQKIEIELRKQVRDAQIESLKQKKCSNGKQLSKTHRLAHEFRKRNYARDRQTSQPTEPNSRKRFENTRLHGSGSGAQEK
jgi:hypothetical protein